MLHEAGAFQALLVFIPVQATFCKAFSFLGLSMCSSTATMRIKGPFFYVSSEKVG